MKNEDSSTKSWSSVADDWIAHADTDDYRNCFLMPRMLAMVGDVRGLRVLDIGCGEGGYARELARRGAHVTGVDGSERVVEVARERSRAESLPVDYICANASALEDVPEGSFDITIAAMSLMDVEDYIGAIREIRRVLMPGGMFFISMLHPCFTMAGAEWQRDERDRHELLFYKVDGYFDRAVWEERVTRSFHAPVLRRHRPLQDYMRALTEQGLLLRDFEEPDLTAEELKASPRFAKIGRIPYFLFMKWQKPDASPHDKVSG